MKARPAWIRKVVTMAWMALGLGFVGVIYFYSQVTADIDEEGFKEPNALDAQEAQRKLGLYKKALEASARSGFIRLTEVEINSYLSERYWGDKLKRATNSPDAGPRLLEGRAKFSGQEILWYCWIRKKWFGLSFPLVWRRGMELRGGTNNWNLTTRSMRLGKLQVPARYWPLLSKELGDVDRLFAEDRRWVEKLPWVEIRTNNVNAAPELRLYTHPVAPRVSAQRR
ncbi:MAG: hypothetical protein HYY23_22575 [Verrucomicrobia bacterium]|nr:hypothetical protein [Verrucomicrobiota bacterium]